MAIDEEGSEIRELDRYNRLWILTELRKHSHPLTHQSDSLYNIVNGQVVSETKVHVQDVVEIGQDTRTSFTSSLPGGFHHPIKKTVAQCKSRSVVRRSRGNLFTTWKQFSCLPRSLTSTTAWSNGARHCARDCWEWTHFQEATQSHIPMEEERCQPCEYSLKRTSTNLIQSYSETPAHNGHCFFLSLHCQKESTSLSAGRHEIYRNRRNPSPLKSLPNRREPGIARVESPFANAVMEGGGQVWPSRCTTDWLWMGNEGT